MPVLTETFNPEEEKPLVVAAESKLTLAFASKSNFIVSFVVLAPAPIWNLNSPLPLDAPVVAAPLNIVLSFHLA